MLFPFTSTFTYTPIYSTLTPTSLDVPKYVQFAQYNKILGICLQVPLSNMYISRRECEWVTGDMFVDPIDYYQGTVNCGFFLVRQSLSNTTKLTDIMPLAGTEFKIPYI